MMPNNSLEFLKDFTAGGIAATISKTTTAPIERVKLILQNQPSIKKTPLERNTMELLTVS